jgi:hypothetical protein
MNKKLYKPCTDCPHDIHKAGNDEVCQRCDYDRLSLKEAASGFPDYSDIECPECHRKLLLSESRCFPVHWAANVVYGKHETRCPASGKYAEIL